ncbi:MULTISPECIES: hypothetical protein, partial [unclassified Microcystis]|uniref:hypothetical protein n=1 Tax=unclassified Microcystis TaxID=2643300 RepID=UPI0022BF4735
FKYFEYKYSIYSLLCDAVALAGAHFVACLKLCFCLYHLLLFKMRIAGSKASYNTKSCLKAIGEREVFSVNSKLTADS